MCQDPNKVYHDIKELVVEASRAHLKLVVTIQHMVDMDTLCKGIGKQFKDAVGQMASGGSQLDTYLEFYRITHEVDVDDALVAKIQKIQREIEMNEEQGLLKATDDR